MEETKRLQLLIRLESTPLRKSKMMTLTKRPSSDKTILKRVEEMLYYEYEKATASYAYMQRAFHTWIQLLQDKGGNIVVG